MQPPKPISRRRFVAGGVLLGTLGVEALLSPLAPRRAGAFERIPPEVAEEMARRYALAEGQDVKRVAPPFAPARLEYYKAGNPLQAEMIPEGPDVMVFRWEMGKLRRWGSTFGQERFPSLMKSLAGIYPQEIEGDPELLRKPLDGDWVVRADAKLENVVPQVERILREEVKLPARLNLREVERKVLVARGRYQFKGLPDRRDNHVEIYAKMLGAPNRGGGGSGELSDCLQWVGMFIHRRVLSEVAGAEEAQVSWHYNERLTSEKERAEDREEAGVIRHFTEQTGITLAEESRKVRVLFLEKT
jgi:hypothetical protein